MRRWSHNLRSVWPVAALLFFMRTRESLAANWDIVVEAVSPSPILREALAPWSLSELPFPAGEYSRLVCLTHTLSSLPIPPSRATPQQFMTLVTTSLSPGLKVGFDVRIIPCAPSTVWSIIDHRIVKFNNLLRIDCDEHVIVVTH